MTVLLTAFIFLNSGADGETSFGLSAVVTQWLNSALEWARIPIELSVHFVRKLAHFAEYSLLGGLLTATVWAWRAKPWRFSLVWISIVIGGCMATLDEFLQSFTPDRNGQFPDVLLDLCGVAWTASAVSLLIGIRASDRSET